MQVRKAADPDADDETDTFTHAVSATGAPEYRGVTADLALDIKELGITLSGSALTQSGLALNEGASAASEYAVALDAPPSGTVRVTVGRDASLSDLTFSADDQTYGATATLDFTTTNWDTAQTVYVKAGADDDHANDSGNITHTASGGGYPGGVNSVTESLATTVTDDDTPALVIAPSPLVMSEGNDAAYTVKLATQPGGSVAVTITRPAGGNTDVTLDTDGDGTFSASETLDFTTGNWNTAQTVTVRADADADANADTATLTHTTTSAYGSLSEALTVQVRERGITLDPASLTLDEGGSAKTYTVRLAAPPSGTVNIDISRGAGLSEVEFSPDGQAQTYAGTLRLPFTTGNWDMVQTVYVKAGTDDDAPDDSGSISHAASGYGSGSVSQGLSVTVSDPDTAGLVIDPSPLHMAEGDSSYTVRLATKPSANVTVTVNRETGNDQAVTGGHQQRRNLRRHRRNPDFRS